MPFHGIQVSEGGEYGDYHSLLSHILVRWDIGESIDCLLQESI